MPWKSDPELIRALEYGQDRARDNAVKEMQRTWTGCFLTSAGILIVLVIGLEVAGVRPPLATMLVTVVCTLCVLWALATGFTNLHVQLTILVGVQESVGLKLRGEYVPPQ